MKRIGGDVSEKLDDVPGVFTVSATSASSGNVKTSASPGHHGLGSASRRNRRWGCNEDSLID